MNPSNPDDRPPAFASRRQFVAAAGALAMTSVAGCSDVGRQLFEANPVVLPRLDREVFWLAETVSDPITFDFDGPAGIDVEITNQARAYDRAAALGGE